MTTQPRRSGIVRLLVGLSWMLAVGTGAAMAQPASIKPEGGPLDSGPGFSFERKPTKTRQSLSGIACPAVAAAPRLCLAAFDEGGEARYLTIDDARIRPEPERVVLVPGKVELDAEGAATDGAFYYVIGSHSAKRGDCENNAGSRRLIRFRIDPATGRGQRDGAGRLVDFTDTGALWSLMAGLPGLKESVGDRMCLGTAPPEGRNGVNIEGLAARDGRLFVGFRGPVAKGTTRILSFDANALFSGGDPAAMLVTIAVGKGRAVRDLLAVSDGILILAGPNDDSEHEKRGWTVLRWDGKAASGGIVQPTPLAMLDLGSVPPRGCEDKIKRKDIKPEAITVLADKPGEPYRAVVFSDGLCDGGALRFNIPR